MGVYYNKLMIELAIPGQACYQIRHVVFDVNGTLALDGSLLDDVARRLQNLSHQAQIHLITANTHGGQAEIDQQLGLQAVILQPGNEAEQKQNFVERLSAETVIAVGQGRNDAAMLSRAAIGIAVLSQEGLATNSLLAADLLLPDIFSVFDCLENPRRLIASLRK